MLDAVGISIVGPVLMLLRSLHVEIQYEGCLLVKQLISYHGVRKEILEGLVSLLRPSKIDLSAQPEGIYIVYLIIHYSKVDDKSVLKFYTMKYKGRNEIAKSNDTEIVVFFCFLF